MSQITKLCIMYFNNIGPTIAPLTPISLFTLRCTARAVTDAPWRGPRSPGPSCRGKSPPFWGPTSPLPPPRNPPPSRRRSASRRGRPRPALWCPLRQQRCRATVAQLSRGLVRQTRQSVWTGIIIFFLIAVH